LLECQIVSLAGLTFSYSKACCSSIAVCEIERQQQIHRIRVRTYCISRKIDLCIKERTAFYMHFCPCSITESCCPVTLPLYQSIKRPWSDPSWLSGKVRYTARPGPVDRRSSCGSVSFTVPSTGLFNIWDMILNICFHSYAHLRPRCFDHQAETRDTRNYSDRIISLKMTARLLNFFSLYARHPFQRDHALVTSRSYFLVGFSSSEVRYKS